MVNYVLIMCLLFQMWPFILYYKPLVFTENFALNKPTWPLHLIPYTSSSVYAQSWTSDKAVEGLKKDLTAFRRQYTISVDYKTTAEWRVDLGDIFSVHHIVIYYRTEKSKQGNTGRKLTKSKQRPWSKRT